ncbi:universal stress protein [Sphingobium sp. AP49]|uniref:universal stress protein n=1 Tax=Sphingobium sp. AP49 TaxID=1144307 RepID=UPI00026ECF22|nr:universal stress protein [Sphingobium sp. AP49]WHO37939.1 universal stress protein [Sphingobium sp. AP49]
MPVQPTILIASDLSARSDRAFDRSVQLATQLNGALLLVHVLDKGHAEEASYAATRANAVIAKLTAGLSIPVEAQLADGRAPEVIASIAGDRRCDLIVVGPARHNGVGDFILGTAVDYLVRRANEPVLIVKDRPQGPYQRILVATDFSDCSLQALLAATRIFPDTRFDLVHIYDGGFPSRLDPAETLVFARSEAERESARFLARPELTHAQPFQVELIEGRAGEMLPMLIAERNIDLLVLGSHGNGGFIHALIGSRASELLEAAPCDVLMVRTAGK